MPTTELAKVQKQDAAALSLLRELEKAGSATPTSLELPEGLSFDRYESLGRFLGEISRRSRWYIGDWILYGERTFEEKYAQAMEATGLSKESLRRYAWICQRITPSRRREGVPIGVHGIVASLPPREQRRWLALAEREQLSEPELRARLRDAEAIEGRAREVPAATKNGSGATALEPLPEERTARGLPTVYAVPGPVVRRLVQEATPARGGYMRVPSSLIERLRSVME